MGILSPIVGQIFDKIGARILLITGLGIISITTFFFTNLSSETTLTYLTIVFAIRMIGIAMVMMPSTTAGLNALPTRLIPHGTAMTNTMRQVAASIGTATLVTVMSLGAFGSRQPDMLIQGVNIAFYVASAFSCIGFILTLFVKDIRHPLSDKLEKEESV